MPSPLLLFIAEGCRFSRDLMNDYGECLTRISDRIFYFDVKDTNVKRKRVTQRAIDYHRIKQFPSLVCENGSILQSAASIASAIQDLCQIAPHPQFTNLKEENGPSGPRSPFQHHSVSADLSHIGSWPTPDQPSAADPRQQGEQPPYAQQQMYPPPHQGYPQQQQAQGHYPHQTQQQQQQQQSNGVGGYDPHQYVDAQQGGGFNGIGGGGLVGAGETNMAQNGGGNNMDTADIGSWPTNKKINNMNVMGGGGSENGFNSGGDPRDRAQQMYQQKGQMNQQQTGMMMNYGLPVAQPYQMY